MSVGIGVSSVWEVAVLKRGEDGVIEWIECEDNDGWEVMKWDQAVESMMERVVERVREGVM